MNLTRLNFFTILLVGFVDYLGIALVYPIFAAFLFDSNNPLIESGTSLAYRGAILGVLIGLTPLTQFFSSPLLGRLSDILGRKFVLSLGTAVGCFGYLIAVAGIQVGSLALLFFYRFLIGVSEGTIAVAQAMIADMSSQEEKARRFSLFNASLGAGFTVGPFIGGKLADPSFASWSGYVTPFVFAGAMCLINLLLILWKIPSDRKLSAPPFSLQALSGFLNIKRIFLWPTLRYLLLATFVFSFGWSFFNEFIPLFLQAHFSFAPSEIGNYYAYGGFWYAVNAAILTAPLLRRFAPEKIVMKALIGCAACMLLMLYVDQMSSLIWILPLFMYCLSAVYPTMGALVSNKAGPENQGEALGVYSSVIGIAMGTSPLLVGSLVGVYPDLTAWGGAISMVLASALLWIGARKSLRSPCEAKVPYQG